MARRRYRKQQQAAGKQQASSNQHLPPWKNDQIKFYKSTQYTNWTFSRRTAPKQWNRSITKSCGDAKIELFPGARPPDTTFNTFTSWYDLTLALVIHDNSRNVQNLRSMCAKACEQFIAGMGWPYDLQSDRPLGHSEVLIVLFPQNIQNIPKLSSKLANLSLVTSYHKVALCHSTLLKYRKSATKWINHLSNISFLIAKSCYIYCSYHLTKKQILHTGVHRFQYRSASRTKQVSVSADLGHDWADRFQETMENCSEFRK